MAITKLVLRKDKINKKGLTAVYVSYSLNQKTTYFGTGVMIDPSHWICPAKGSPYIDSVRGISPNKANEELLKELKRDDVYRNSLINRKLSQINQVIDRYNIEFHTYPDFQELKKRIDDNKQDPQGNPIVNNNLFIDQFERFKDDAKTDPEIKPATYQHYVVANNHLKDFLKVKKLTHIKLEEFNKRVLEDFKKYLLAPKPKGKGLAVGTAKKNFDKIKKFLNRKSEDGIYPFNIKKITIRAPRYTERAVIYLTDDEIEKLRNHNLKEFSLLDKVRDLFLFSASTGLRYSDVMRFKKELIKGNFIKMTLRKNNKKVKIPIVRFTQEILDKYDYQLPKISNQKINEYLKILAKEAELTDGIILNDHKGKDTDGKIFIKHQVISFHAARKTFVMWSVDNGVSIETLEETVGDTYTSLKHYYEITETKIMGEYGKISESNMKVS